MSIKMNFLNKIIRNINLIRTLNIKLKLAGPAKKYLINRSGSYGTAGYHVKFTVSSLYKKCLIALEKL